MKVKEGEYVRIVDREVTPADVKSGNYYPYFRGLAGVVDRIYDNEVCLKIDTDSLPESIRKRHLEVQESIKRKWLNNLSGEARNRLTPEEKQFQLAYTLLVQADDLEKVKPGDRPKPVEAKPAEVKAPKPVNAPLPIESAEEPAAEEDTAQKAAEAKVVTEKDLEAAELAHLREREEQLKGEK